MMSEPSSSCFRFSPRWVVLCAAVAATVLAHDFAGPARARDDKVPPPAPPATIRLVIDHGDGFEKHYTSVPWKQGMTVLDAMEFARAHKHATPFEFKGRAETAFLSRLDGVANQGAGRDKLNWIYHVNGKLADKGFAVCELKAGDQVLWRYQTYRVHDASGGGSHDSPAGR